jgi:hypothetical protein
MATFSKEFLSGSTDGLGVLVAATATPGTLVHTAHATGKDEIWIYATNNDTVAVTLTVEFGDATATNNIVLQIPSKSGLTLVAPGLVLTNSKTVNAFAGTTNKITLTGYVNRIL